MTIETQVTWVKPTDPATVSAIQAKAQELIAVGKEVGNVIINEEATQVVVNRFWIDTPAADEWIAFVTGYNPVSAFIVSS